MELENTSDLITLTELKEEIKSQVTDNKITWHQRIELYRKVQMINDRIIKLEEGSSKARRKSGARA